MSKSRSLVRNPIVLALGVLVIAIAVRYAGVATRGGTVMRDAPVAEPVRAQEPVAPSAANVSHDFKRRVAELGSRMASDPADTAAVHELARMRFDAHDMAAAVPLYRRYLEQAPEARQAWLDLATALAAQEDWEGAEEAMHNMLDRFPDDPSATYNLGAIAANQGRPDEAASWWHRTMQSSDTLMAGMALRSLRSLGGS